MKKTIAASVLSLTALALSPLASAAETSDSGAMQLTAAQMDDVTAGRHHAPIISFRPVVTSQTNNSSTTILQIGNNNIAIVFNGNIIIRR
jgi:hypothetical protein